MERDLRNEFIRLLKEDEKFRYEVLGLLGLREIVDELRKLRRDFNRYIKLSEERWKENARLWEENFKRWEENNRRWEENEKRWELNAKLWEENFKRWEENEKRWEENEKRWEENFKRWEENEKRWQENNRRWEENEKRWEINARLWEENFKRWEENEKRWQENFKRWEENEKRWELNAKLWEENFKRWEENNRRWEENEKRWKENEKRWEENDKRWELNFKLWEENFKRWEEADKKFKWLMNALTELRDAVGGGFEYYTSRVVKLLMKERGIDCDVRANVTLPIDGYKEVDIFCDEPLIVGEVTVSLRSIEEAKNQLEKLNIGVAAAEKLTNKKVYLKVLAVESAKEEVANFLKEISEKEGIYLILGRENEIF
jgi:hypothetical protein